MNGCYHTRGKDIHHYCSTREVRNKNNVKKKTKTKQCSQKRHSSSFFPVMRTSCGPGVQPPAGDVRRINSAGGLLTLSSHHHHHHHHHHAVKDDGPLVSSLTAPLPPSTPPLHISVRGCVCAHSFASSGAAVGG